MIDETQSSSKVSEGDARRGRCGVSRRVRHGIAAAALIALGAVIGAVSTLSSDVMAFGRHGHGGESGHMLQRMQHKASWMLASVDASEEQEARVDAIIAELAQQLAPIREQKRDTRQAFMAELIRTDINRDKLEQLRQSSLALFDQASSIMTDAIVRAAQVLTPEQREELLAKRHHFRH